MEGAKGGGGKAKEEHYFHAVWPPLSTNFQLVLILYTNPNERNYNYIVHCFIQQNLWPFSLDERFFYICFNQLFSVHTLVYDIILDKQKLLGNEGHFDIKFIWPIVKIRYTSDTGWAYFL